MEQYIKKSDIVAEIERLKECNRKICGGNFDFLKKSYPEHYYSTEIYDDILSFLDTLEVKEIHEDIDVDLNPIFEEFGIDPDSRFASMFKESFYKGIDRYLNKKEGKV